MIENFLSYLYLEKRYSNHTLLAYKNDLINFNDFINSNYESQQWMQINHKDIRSWIVNLSEQKYTEKSINRKLSSLRSFFKYLKRQGTIKINPAQLVQGPKVRKRLPKYIPEKDINSNKVVKHSDDSYENQMVHLMIEVFYQTGMRLSELINMKWSDLNPNFVKVLGKRNKERIIPISTKLYDEFEFFRIVKKRESPQQNDLIFLTKKGNKVYPKFVYRKVNNYIATVSSIEKKSPHVLRHTFATHMLNNGASLEMIKEILGHSSLVATQVYTHNSLSKLKQVYKQAHPRGG